MTITSFPLTQDELNALLLLGIETASALNGASDAKLLSIGIGSERAAEIRAFISARIRAAQEPHEAFIANERAKRENEARERLRHALTVAQLIERLQTMPHGLPVTIPCGCSCGEMSFIDTIEVQLTDGAPAPFDSVEITG